MEKATLSNLELFAIWCIAKITLDGVIHGHEADEWKKLTTEGKKIELQKLGKRF
jgi:hypothetical protein